jgi:hypothetical protein
MNAVTYRALWQGTEGLSGDSTASGDVLSRWAEQIAQAVALVGDQMLERNGSDSSRFSPHSGRSEEFGFFAASVPEKGYL